MKMSAIFEKVFNRIYSMVYIIELDLDTECTDKSPNCKICAGTGNVIKKVYKIKAFVDNVQQNRTILAQFPNIKLGDYYNDGRVGYFLKDSNFDLSPNIKRVVLNIVNENIDSVFDVKYLEPMVERGEVIFYLSSLSKVNISSSQQTSIYKQILKERGL